ncbi:saccharopine dehydrogenase-like oxidoreductase isoform X1 [Vespa crabro]|uniref:saccharopine dehydrogenase-like oxidoreductase isoform X1 n=2 Tax=Vespa crabro TaxID=7445 RepID=UPI001F01436E|nr:saccharopine dehydrogenase-like oxidoreductase isoform X1 [Vespa crabro]
MLKNFIKMKNNKLDIIIFGATGFTGQYVVKEAARLAKETEFNFGVAGRRKEALESTVKACAPDIENVPIIIADIKDEESLKKMVEKAKVLVNCCGPYIHYGEPVIKACIAAKIHYVDVTGEALFIEEMQLKYNEAAQNAGIYIVNACGFDSIPSDLGMVFTQQKFGGEVNSTEVYFSTSNLKNCNKPVANFTSLESLIYGFNQKEKLRDIRKKIFSKKLPELKPKLKFKGWLPHKCAFTNEWSIAFPGADRSIIYRSQRYFFEKYNQRPIQAEVYIGFSSLFYIFMLSFMIILYFLMKFSYGRSLILKYPKLFTYGFISHEEPTEKTLNELKLSFTFLARGWTEKLSEPSDVHSDPPNKEMVTKVTGVNPYAITSVAVMLCALIILKESDKMPEGGGIFTTAAAFSKTSLIDELNKKCLKFEVVSSIEK